MKNLKSFPFERNRYFYGKLLSVEDFETEQKYFNDKRRTINRFLFGSGVVSGLNVVEVDDESISVERGLALDFAGREIMLDEPAVRKLTELEGYGNGHGNGQEEGYYYLCLEYQEEATELMHNVTGAAGRNSSEFNKYKEGYRLFVTQEEPERDVYSPARLYEERKTVYQGQDIQIVQVLPKFLEMGHDTALRVEITYTGQQKFSFEYELELAFLTNEEGNRVRIAFQGNESGKGGKYQMEVPLRTACVSNVQAQASLVRDSFRLQIGNKTYSDARPCISQASVNDVDDYEALQIQYYRTAMDYIMGNTFHQGIYLAKIYVVRAGNICLIERIEQLPFDQKIMHTEISTAIIQKLVEDVRKLKEAKLLEKEKQEEQKGEKPLRAACGEILFDIGRMRLGEVRYSDEIVHGLGFGPVTIELSYEVDRGLDSDTQILFGDTSIFKGKDSAAVSLAARLMPTEGTFVVGLKILKNDGAKQVRVHWTALRNEARKAEPEKKKRIFIQPDNPNVFVGESLVFTASLEGFSDERLKWSVKDSGGGVIDKNGKYTAPETEGIYQIAVSSVAYPEVQVSTFVIVRERKGDGYGN